MQITQRLWQKFLVIKDWDNFSAFKIMFRSKCIRDFGHMNRRDHCGGNAKSGLETVIEHQVVRQGQARGAQAYAVHMNVQYGY